MSMFSPGLQNAFLRNGVVPTAVKKSCTKCGFCMPPYKGRYPVACPNCTEAFDRGNPAPEIPIEDVGRSMAMRESIQEVVSAALRGIRGGYDPEEIAQDLFEMFSLSPGCQAFDADETPTGKPAQGVASGPKRKKSAWPEPSFPPRDLHPGR